MRYKFRTTSSDFENYQLWIPDPVNQFTHREERINQQPDSLYRPHISTSLFSFTFRCWEYPFKNLWKQHTNNSHLLISITLNPLRPIQSFIHSYIVLTNHGMMQMVHEQEHDSSEESERREERKSRKNGTDEKVQRERERERGGDLCQVSCDSKLHLWNEDAINSCIMMIWLSSSFLLLPRWKISWFDNELRGKRRDIWRWFLEGGDRTRRIEWRAKNHSSDQRRRESES